MSDIEEREKELFENIEKIGRIHLQDENDDQGEASGGSMSFEDLKKFSETIHTTLIRSVNLMNQKLQNIRRDIENFGRDIREQHVQLNAQAHEEQQQNVQVNAQQQHNVQAQAQAPQQQNVRMNAPQQQNIQAQAQQQENDHAHVQPQQFAQANAQNRERAQANAQAQPQAQVQNQARIIARISSPLSGCRNFSTFL